MKGIQLPVVVFSGRQCQAAREQQLQSISPDSDPVAKLRGKVTLEALFCFPALRFDAFPPNRDSRNCCAPKPGKEKQKSYDYRSAILITHKFESFHSGFTPVMRRIWREVTRKMAARAETWPTPRSARARGTLELKNPQFSDAHAPGCVPDSAQT